MRKVICVLTALLLCVSLACPAMAIAIDFSPSIAGKAAPTPDRIILRESGKDDVDITNCVVVTSIREAQLKTTDITQEERDLLLDVYGKVADGSMELPLKKGFVIRDLVDISFKYSACRIIEEHNHKDIHLKEEDVVLVMDFTLGISKDTEVVILTYIDEKWEEIEEVVNNGDGTITCTFEDICPVAFAVRNARGGENPDTGDQVGNNMGLWIGVMAVCAVSLVALVVIRRKKTK